MFDLGWTELLIVAAIALIVIGPKELPGVLRMLGQWMAKIRRMASDFQGQFNEAMREAEMADLKKEVDDLADTARDFTSEFDPVGSIEDSFDDPFDDKPKTADKAKTDEKTPAVAETEDPAHPPAEPASDPAPEPAPGVTDKPPPADEPEAETHEGPPPQKAAAGGHPA